MEITKKNLIALFSGSFIIFSAATFIQVKISHDINEEKLNKILVKLSELQSENKILMDWKKSSKIKSLTLRLRSDDDRLRIYWQDGKVSDFPCTKEQRTWACG